MQPGKRADEVHQARQYIADTRKAEVDKVAEELRGMEHRLERRARGRRGSAATPTAPPGVEVKVETDRANNEVTAGEPMNLKLTVTNKGPARSIASSR